MLDKLEGVGRTAGHAAELILDRTATVDPWLLGLGTLLYLVAQTVRPRGWHTILRAAFPEATDLRPRDVIRAYLAGAGVNAVVPARGGDVVKLALVRRRIPGARYSTLAATFIPETLFETAFGTALVAWALAMGFIPIPTTTGELPALDVSLVLAPPEPSRPRSWPWRWSCSRPSGARSCGRCAAPCAKGRRSSPRRGASPSASRAGRRSRASSGSAPSRPSWAPSACR